MSETKLKLVKNQKKQPTSVSKVAKKQAHTSHLVSLPPLTPAERSEAAERPADPAAKGRHGGLYRNVDRNRVPDAGRVQGPQADRASDPEDDPVPRPEGARRDRRGLRPRRIPEAFRELIIRFVCGLMRPRCVLRGDHVFDQ